MFVYISVLFLSFSFSLSLPSSRSISINLSSHLSICLSARLCVYVYCKRAPVYSVRVPSSLSVFEDDISNFLFPFFPAWTAFSSWFMLPPVLISKENLNFDTIIAAYQIIKTWIACTDLFSHGPSFNLNTCSLMESVIELFHLCYIFNQCCDWYTYQII